MIIELKQLPQIQLLSIIVFQIIEVAPKNSRIDHYDKVCEKILYRLVVKCWAKNTFWGKRFSVWVETGIRGVVFPVFRWYLYSQSFFDISVTFLYNHLVRKRYLQSSTLPTNLKKPRNRKQPRKDSRALEHSRNIPARNGVWRNPPNAQRKT